MRNLNFTSMVRLFLLTCVLTLVPLSVAAQNANNSGGSSTQSTTQTTRTTETTQPNVQVTHTTTQAIDPLWLGVGAVVLLAILAILVMSMRGRTADRTSVVNERETVVRRD